MCVAYFQLQHDMSFGSVCSVPHGRMTRRSPWHALLVAVALLPCLTVALGASLPWIPLGPSHPRQDIPETPWSRTIDQLWNATRAQVAFCIGDDREKARALLARSFPWPLPAGPPGDAICADSRTLEPFLCRPAEIEQYVRVSWVLERTTSGWDACQRWLQWRIAMCPTILAY